ncbi:MAG: CHC2 zinc finger domain-containing protein [Clostridia bacterium]
MTARWSKGQRAVVADIVKRVVPMRMVCEMYGLDASGHGHALCPFHKEKTGSFKLYEDGFKCFGCGAHGDQIDYVRRLFGVTFDKAVCILNDDFSLSLPIDKPSDQAARDHWREARRGREERREARRDALLRYGQAFDRWMLYDRLMGTRTPYSVMWNWAAGRIDRAAFELEEADGRLKEARRHG